MPPHPCVSMSAGDDHLMERPLQQQQVYQGHFLDVRRDTVALPDGDTAGREYIVGPANLPEPA